MIEIKGKYNTAKVFAYTADNETMRQIYNILNQPFTANSNIRMMPDVHAGSGACVGTTMTISGEVAPALVGDDIGCGMETTVLNQKEIDLAELDRVIHRQNKSGRKNQNYHKFADEIKWDALRCLKKIDVTSARQSMGTLGGGNHFIELGRGSDDKLYLVVHSGSRYFGKQVAEYYQKRAREYYKDRQPELIQQGLHKIDIGLAYVEGALLDDYLHDMALAQKFSVLNRRTISGDILKALGLTADEQFTTVHNYIDLDYMILRKGAVSAQSGERLLIPINMRDGSLLCEGKGNPDWNFSAPHGAGRLMSRGDAKKSISLEDYKQAMSGVYTTTVSHSTLDESPFAYKPMEEIIDNIGGTVELLDIIKPLYNFKASAVE